MKYESSLEYCEERKRCYKVCRIKERPNMNFWPMYYVKSFEKLFCMNLIMSLYSMKSLEPV